jgi:cellulose synthase/poly-beta-1,6-N-acetylglucosamine synthase-like glycosyltransferase
VNKNYDQLSVSKRPSREAVKGPLEMESETGNLPDGIASPFQNEFHCSIGIMAYNEAGNIARALQSVLEQRTTTCIIDEILVVASGCTDNTEAIVREFCEKYPCIRLITQATREGKASAINVFLNIVKTDILVLVGADTIPGPDSIQLVIEPFIDPDVGMTGGHPIPLNDPQTFMGFTVHLLWELHHQVALRTPKMGELLAFRRIFQRIPVRSAVDDAAMEPLVFGQGYRLCYVPEATVKNRGPQTLKDFLKQRRRIYAGHLRMRQTLGYQASTVSTQHILLALLHAWQWNWRFILWTPAVIALEVYGRFLGWVDYKYKKKSHAVWDRIDTTKVL